MKPVPFAELLQLVRARTPARILAGRAGPAYRTATQLELRCDHAAAVDAVHAELDLLRDLGSELIDSLLLFLVQSRASSKAEYLLRPDLGRQLSESSCERLRDRCPTERTLQIVIGDGLSPAAVAAQVPQLLPLLIREAQQRGWRIGRPFAVRYCRVGVLNPIGELLDPEVVVLLIGERPGLATAESLSAYMAYRPRPGHTDAHRNLISNIHARGVAPAEAAHRIVALAEQMRQARTSGVAVKEELPSISPLDRLTGVKDDGHS
jgi:ethanolamine ammonia-lyase small subunit